MSAVKSFPPRTRPIPAPLSDLAWLLWSVSRDTLDGARPGDGPQSPAVFGLAFLEEVARVDGPRRPPSLARMAEGSARAIRTRVGIDAPPPLVA